MLDLRSSAVGTVPSVRGGISEDWQWMAPLLGPLRGLGLQKGREDGIYRGAAFLCFAWLRRWAVSVSLDKSPNLSV